MKTFYESGKVRGTFWYENGLREDSAKWYFDGGGSYSEQHLTKEIQSMEYRNSISELASLKPKLDTAKDSEPEFEEYNAGRETDRRLSGSGCEF